MKIVVLLLTVGLCSLTPSVSNALTDEEVRLLRHNGVSAATIRMMHDSERRATADAAGRSMGVRRIIRSDGRPAIVYSTGDGRSDALDDAARLREERAWEMLRHLIVDIDPPLD